MGTVYLQKFADYTKLAEVAGTAEGCAAFQRDINRQEKWADRSLVKFAKEKCEALHLRKGISTCQGPPTWKAAQQERTWVPWWTPRWPRATKMMG